MNYRVHHDIREETFSSQEKVKEFLERGKSLNPGSVVEVGIS